MLDKAERSARNTPIAQKACDIQSALMNSIQNEKESAMSKAQCSRAWLEIEQAKREWRGKPRLKPAEAPRTDKHARKAALTITEAPTRKESIIPPPPVPAPPTPTPKSTAADDE